MTPETHSERRDGSGGRTGREPIFNLPAIVVVFVAACAAIHLLRAFVLTQVQDIELQIAAAFIPVRYSGAYDLDVWAFTSPLTYSLLHGGMAHLAVNMVWLAAFGSPLANRIGPVRFVLFWCVTALAAVLLHYLLHAGSAVPLVGASGAISGMMGAAARFGFRVDRRGGRPAFLGPVLGIGETFRSRTVLAFLGIWMAINLVTGLMGSVPGAEGGIAWEAHIGGMVAGFLGVRLFDRRGSR